MTGVPSTPTANTTNLVTLTYSLEKPSKTGSSNRTETFSSGPCTITYTVTIVPVPVEPASHPPTVPVATVTTSIPAPLTTYGVSCDKGGSCKTVTVIIPPFTSVVDETSIPNGSYLDTTATPKPEATIAPVIACHEDKGCTTITVTIPSINTLTLGSVGNTGSVSVGPTSAPVPQPTAVPIVTCDKDKGCTTFKVTIPNANTLTLGEVSPEPTLPFPSKPEHGTPEQPSQIISIPELTIPSTSEDTAFSGYRVVPSPSEEATVPTSGASVKVTSSIIPVWTAQMLGNAYGGGIIIPPSIYVTPVSSASVAEVGIPPGYGITYGKGEVPPSVGIPTAIATVTPPVDLSNGSPVTKTPPPKTYIETTIVTTITSSETTFVITTKFPAGLPIASGILIVGGSPAAGSHGAALVSSNGPSKLPTGPVYFVGVTPLPSVPRGGLQAVYSSVELPSTGAVSPAAQRASSSNFEKTPAIESSAPTSGTLAPVTPSVVVPKTQPAPAPISYVVGIISSSAGGSPVTYTIPPYTSASTNVALPPVEASESPSSQAAQETPSAGSGAEASLYNALTSALATSGDSLSTLIETSGIELPTGPSLLPVASLTPVLSGAPGTGSGGNGSLSLPLGPTAIPVYEGNATAVTVSVSLWFIILVVTVVFL